MVPTACRSARQGSPRSVARGPFGVAWPVVVLVLGMVLTPSLHAAFTAAGSAPSGVTRQSAGGVAERHPAVAPAGHRWYAMGAAATGEIALAGHRWGVAVWQGSQPAVTLAGHRWGIVLSPGVPPSVAI